MNNNYIDIIRTITGTHFILINVKNKEETAITTSEAEIWYHNKGYARWSDKALTYMEEVILNPECIQI